LHQQHVCSPHVFSIHLVTELSDLSIPARPISLEERQTGFLSFPKREDSAGSNASSQRSAELKNIKYKSNKLKKQSRTQREEEEEKVKEVAE